MKELDDLSVIGAVDALVRDAIQARASDIHLEPTATELYTRMRIDGVLQSTRSFPQNIKLNIISRIKVLASIDIAEQRLPQDGKFVMSYDSRSIDIRVSTFPSVYGEKVVVRILDTSRMQIGIDQLGFAPAVEDQFLQLITQPQGFFLVTGPTGSGKTTTLYAALSQVNSTGANIITLEDPVEYYIGGVTQGQIRPRIGFDFARGMRSILRQDPDIIMIGELRDTESAHTAIESALTGHLVMSTVHTNDAPSAIIRLMDLGIESYLINASLSGVLAQRLIRKNCTECNELYVPTQAEAVFLESRQIDQSLLRAGVGCAQCNHTGFHGRLGIFELLIIDDELRSYIAEQPRFDQLRAHCIDRGMRTLMDDACDKITQGLVAPAEVMRVITR